MDKTTLLALGLAGAAALTPAVAQADVGAALYQRALIASADSRCRLFASPVSAVVSAGVDQARGDALRAGAADGAVAQLIAQARLTAQAVDCASPSLRLVADRVQKAYAGYARLPSERFPGQFAAWRADRQGRGGWRLVQTAQGAPTGLSVAFGLGPSGRPEAQVAGPGADRLAGARLLFRDERIAAQPYIDPRAPGLAGRAAPASVSRAVYAQDRDTEANRATFRFSPAALDALAELDPREAATLELIAPDQSVRRVFIEAGDLRAARAFLAAR